MRSIAAIRPLFLALSLGTALFVTSGCRSSSTVTAESIEKAPDAITEDGDNGSVTWSVGSDGKVRALVKSPDGKPITQNVSGQLTWASSPADTPVPLVLDEKTGLLVGSGPALTEDLTPVAYTLTVEGKPWTGTLHLPRGGTQALADDAREAAAKPRPAGELGPNGGVVQVVGDDRVEIVADKGSGQVRVYVLDADLHVAPLGERTIKLAIGGDTPEVVVIAAEPGGRYGTGKLVTGADPVRITVAITVKERTHACIVGWSPGVHLVVGARAPRVRILVASGFAVPGVDVKVRVQAPSPALIIVHDGDDDGKGKHGHGHGHGHGDAKISVKVR